MMNSLCSYYDNNVCKICPKINTEYTIQLNEKVNASLSALKLEALDLIVPTSLTQFRDKVKIQVSGSYSRPVIGFLDAQTLKVENEILACPLHNQKINSLIAKMKSLLNEFQIQPYDIHTKKGELKHLIFFSSPTTGQTYVRFVLRSKEAKDRISKLVKKLGNIHCASLNIQPLHAAILEGDEELYLTENKFITHQFGEIKMLLSPQGFVQTNTQVASKLYKTARLWAESLSLDKIADVYCGQGAFSFHMQGVAPEILGIEINAKSIEMANLSKKQFDYKIKFKASDAVNLEAELTKFKAQLVIVNPPRAGLKNFAQILNTLAPNYILYSSCNLATLAKDLEVLGEQYQIQKSALFDMFAHTNHFEVLILLKKIRYFVDSTQIRQPQSQLRR